MTKHFALISAAVMLALLGGCGGSSDAPAVASTPGANTSVPTPDEDQRAALLAGLRKVNAGLIANEDRAVDRARNVCLDIIQGQDAADVTRNAEARFEGGTVPDVTAQQAAAIVAAIRSSFCS